MDASQYKDFIFGMQPDGRKGKILFINADRDYEEGRAQNYLRAEHAEKIVQTFQRFEEISRYSRIVTIGEIADEDFNLNIRRYADTSPPPEPQDVRKQAEEACLRKLTLMKRGLMQDLLTGRVRVKAPEEETRC